MGFGLLLDNVVVCFMVGGLLCDLVLWFCGLFLVLRLGFCLAVLFSLIASLAVGV